MTVEELRSLAVSMGYKIIPIKEPVHIDPCPICKHKSTQEWITTSPKGYKRKCSYCGFCGDIGETSLDSKRKWNDAVRRYHD